MKRLLALLGLALAPGLIAAAGDLDLWQAVFPPDPATAPLPLRVWGLMALQMAVGFWLLVQGLRALVFRL